MKFIIITYIPNRDNSVSSIPEKTTIDECEKDTIEEVIGGLHVPLDGYCLIVNQDDVVKITSKIVNLREQ
jgi:hypothetical protein